MFNQDTASAAPGTPALTSASPAMQHLRQRMAQVALCQAPVLLLGETGVGKEVVAQQLVAMRQAHAGRSQPRSRRPFVALNCGGLTATLAASELFGHVRGAFTGAQCVQPGAFCTADGGTLFLDEIGELPLAVQPQLLRVLERGEVRAVGAAQAQHVHVQVIAATHQNLPQAVAAGQFRADLWHRLGVLILHVPPLRHRQQDIVPLVHALCAQLGQPQLRLTPQAWSRLLAYGWPGNVRELKNVLQRAWVFRTGDSPVDIDSSDLCPMATGVGNTPSPTAVHPLAVAEHSAITAALAAHGGNRRAAAAALGCSRSTLYRRLMGQKG